VKTEKCKFCVSPYCQVVHKHVIWGGIVRRLLTVYFISNISAKKYQNVLMYVKVIANQRWDVSLRHSVLHEVSPYDGVCLLNEFSLVCGERNVVGLLTIMLKSIATIQY